MAKRTWTMTILILVGLVTSAVIGSVYWPSRKSVVMLCLPKSPSSALPALAQELGFFQREGLDVRTKLADNCRTCVADLASGQFDLAVSSLYSAVETISSGQNISVITELHSSTENTAIVYRKSLDSLNPAKQTWKKVALVKKSNAETLLRLFFKAHQISSEEPEFFPVESATEIPPLLLSKKVDAAVLPEPALSQLLEEYPDLFKTSHSSFYTEFSVLSSRADFATKRTDDLDRFIRALSKAQEFYRENPEKAQRLIASHLELDLQKINPLVWPKLRMSLGLSSVLKLMIEQEAINFLQHGDQNLAETSAINSSSALFPQALRKISPDLVTFE